MIPHYTKFLFVQALFFGLIMVVLLTGCQQPRDEPIIIGVLVDMPSSTGQP
ncbi:MAG: hypothetical protein ACJA2O_004116 [Candidatus Azotimanducaceae bacterium]|jgi:hypothetical protein